MLDALVVGAGPAGLTLASELLAHGLKVRIVEKALVPPPDMSRALAIQIRTLELFERFGMIDEVLKRSRTVRAVNIMGKSRHRARAPLEAIVGFHTPYPEMRMLPQHETETLLEQRLNSLGGKVERGVQLLGYVQDTDHVRVEVQGQEGKGDISARWLLGCDGSKSAVRKGADISFDGDTYDDLCMVGDVDLTWDLADGELYVFPSARGLAVAFPQPGERRFRVVCVLPSGGVAEGRDLSTEEFTAELNKLVPVPVQVTAARFTSRYRLHHRVAAKFRHNRVFLCGDAAHVHSPVGGQGMNTGIQDAHNLAWKLAAVTQNRAPAWVLDSYEVERRRVALKLVQQTDRMFGLAAGHGVVGGIMRRLAPRLAPHLLPRLSIRAGIFGFFSQLRIHYPHSPLTTACASELIPRPGERAPDTALRTAAGAVTRLFSHLDSKQHTLLLFSGQGKEAMGSAALGQLAEQMGKTFDGLVKPLIIASEGSAQNALSDDGQAHTLYSATVPTAFIVRPDGYVAFRMAFPDVATVQKDLAHRLVARP